MDHEEPQEPFSRLSVADVKHMIESGDVQAIDPRESHECQNRHVPGAERIPVGAVFARRNELSRVRDVIFVCGVGQRSALACEMAPAAGRRWGFHSWRGLAQEADAGVDEVGA